MAVVVLSRPAQAWPITYTPRAHVCKTLGGSFIQRHILSRQWEAAGGCSSVADKKRGAMIRGGAQAWTHRWVQRCTSGVASADLHQSPACRPCSEANSGWHTCRCVPPLLPHPAHQYCHNEPRKICMPRRVITPSGRNKHYFISKLVSYQNIPKASGLPGWRCLTGPLHCQQTGASVFTV